jgi:hypothetical protein
MEYITHDEHGAVEVHCKGACRRVVAVRGANGQLQPTPLYTDLAIEMREPNGLLSKHITGVCRPCKTRLLAHADPIRALHDIYAQDVKQWVASAMRAGYDRAGLLVAAERQAARTPLRVLFE